MALVHDKDAAKRLARAIVSDVALYNQSKVEQGLREDNLFDLLRDEIAEGRDLYLSRIDTDLLDENFYDLAVVDVLVKGNGHVDTKIF